ncbi:poly(A) polymerase [Ordospora colligata]|uniref:Poly(A) polymerase n=1 Tax=Ordospora colligata OC4 TaxID=1354746 RepID=A0A0B2ULG2_9MICR|nr:poly(A) polymerase [Ordospora colligata OC4]KHN70183.1 poly(A) polymerase [Ordospora colligata OC4]TBU16727.1 poly(A) polymerase [Ordospora colligata]TBU17033.1 poly(A) polymerase [Ordospora colligata]TBU19457.1 poly(A) polymerase [Ordospora colligata]
MEMSEKNYKYGMTGPLSMKESTEEEYGMSVEMDRYLEECGFFEDESEGQTRERVLGRLNFMVKDFVAKMAKSKGGTEGEKQCGGKIFTFGSYRLGVHSKGADIDALCIVPRHVSRSDFFVYFYEELKKNPGIEEITKIEEAFVPIIKFKFQGIPIDLVFARLNVPVVKEGINLLNDTLLKNMDEKCILSLNGSRVTDEMLSLVPNVKVFHSALRCVKYWAKRRCVYGNSYGYFGGVAFSLCVARVCQLYPNVSSFVIVSKFFELFSSWKWPMPVILRPVVDLNFNLKVWDPKIHPSDKYHRMPVITPAYPSMCSTHNVSNSTQHAITTELTRAHEILCMIEKNDNKKGEHEKSTEERLEMKKSCFRKIFELSDFFSKYKLFIEVMATSVKVENEEFQKWEGYVESKIRILASKFEAVDDILYAIPFPKVFEVSSEKIARVCANTCTKEIRRCTVFFIAIDIIPVKGKKVFVDLQVKDFVEFINGYEGRPDGMSIEVHSLKKKDVQEFLRMYYGKPKDQPEESKRRKVGDRNDE